MRYSPLVERYLMAHNYETINNVRKWNMLLTQRSEVQKDVDKKFRKFKQIAHNAQETSKQLNREYLKEKRQLRKDMNECKAQADAHYEKLKKKFDEKKEMGGLAELSNIYASIYKQMQHENYQEDDN